jgi:hypothetical protein
MTDTAPRSTTRGGRVPSAGVLIIAVYALCVLVPLVYLMLVVAFGLDPNGPDTRGRNSGTSASSEPLRW